MRKYAWILNRNTGKKIKWEAWDYQLRLLDLFLVYPELVIDKARQLGITWLLSAYGLWVALFRDGANVMFMSGNESKAWEMLAKSRHILGSLPDFLQLPLKHDGRGWLSFQGSASEMRAISTTDRSGAGTDATLVIRDELREHEMGHENFVAISPCIDGGGQLIDLSTYDKYTPYDKNHFAQRVDKGKKGAPKQMLMEHMEFYDGIEHAKLVFLGWRLRPTRMENLTLDEWYEREVIPKYSPQDREQEYPLTLEESISPPITTSFFDVVAVNNHLLQVYESLAEVSDINTFNGVIKIWKKPIMGERYVVFSDPSDGIGDPFVTIVQDSKGEWVSIATGMEKADIAAEKHDILVRYYNNAPNTCEVNASSGGKFMQTLEKLETPNIAWRRDGRGDFIKDKHGAFIHGWYTSPEMRKIMLDDYEQAIRLNLVCIHYREAVEQHRRFIRDDSGKLRASTGHDDFVMAGAGVWQLQKYAPAVGGIKIRTFKPDKRGNYGNN